MIVDSYREHLLGVVLTDDVVVEDLADRFWGRDTVTRFRQRGRLFLTDYVHAQFDALVADKYGRPGNELAYLALALAAERAVERVLRIAVADLAHLELDKMRVVAAVTPNRDPSPRGSAISAGAPFDLKDFIGPGTSLGNAILLPRPSSRRAIGTPMVLSTATTVAQCTIASGPIRSREYRAAAALLPLWRAEKPVTAARSRAGLRTVGRAE